MQFLTLQRIGWSEPAVLAEGRIIGLRDAGFTDMISLIAGGLDSLDKPP